MDADKDLWRENGLYTSSESDSGESDFDEDYYKLRPPYNLDEHRNSKIITIKCNQFSGDGGNTVNNLDSTTNKSEIVFRNTTDNFNLEVNNTDQTNVQSETVKKIKRKTLKKKPKSTKNEHRNIDSASNNNVTDIRSNCKSYSGDDGSRRRRNLMLYENYVKGNTNYKINQSKGSLRKVYANNSSYTDLAENINTNLSNANNIIAIRDTTNKAHGSNNSFDYSQYCGLLGEIAPYYINLEKEYLSNMSCMNYLLDYEASKLNINVEQHPMPKKELTKKLKNRQQINSTHTIKRNNGIVEAIIEVIVFGLRPFETIFQELWNAFF